MGGKFFKEYLLRFSWWNLAWGILSGIIMRCKTSSWAPNICQIIDEFQNKYIHSWGYPRSHLGQSDDFKFIIQNNASIEIAVNFGR